MRQPSRLVDFHSSAVSTVSITNFPILVVKISDLISDHTKTPFMKPLA
jgi:hypothetical protein